MNITRKMIHLCWNLSVESQRTMGHNEQFRTIGLETCSSLNILFNRYAFTLENCRFFYYVTSSKVGIVDRLKLNLYCIWLHNYTPAAVFFTLNFCFLVCFNKFNPVLSTVSCISFLAILRTLESNLTRYIYTAIIILESSRSLPSFGIRGRAW